MTKQKRSVELRGEIAKTEEKISELRPQLAELENELIGSNAAFMKEEIAIEALLAVRTRRDLTKETIESLERNREELNEELAAVLQVEEHEATVLAMRSLVGKRKKAFQRCMEARQALSDTTSEVLEALAEFTTIQSSFAEHFRKIFPEWSREQGIRPNKNNRAKFETVLAGLERAGITREEFELTLGVWHLPRVEHMPVIEAAERHQAWMAESERAQARLRNIDAVQAKQQEERDELNKRYQDKVKEVAVRQQRGLRIMQDLVTPKEDA